MGGLQSKSDSTDNSFLVVIAFLVFLIASGYFWIDYGRSILLISLAAAYFLFVLLFVYTFLALREALKSSPRDYDEELIEFLVLKMTWIILLTSLTLAFLSGFPTPSSDLPKIANAGLILIGVVVTDIAIIGLTILEFFLCHSFIGNFKWKIFTILENFIVINRIFIFLAIFIISIMGLLFTSGIFSLDSNPSIKTLPP